jgi:hypothetical protein
MPAAALDEFLRDVRRSVAVGRYRQVDEDWMMLVRLLDSDGPEFVADALAISRPATAVLGESGFVNGAWFT